MFNQRTKSVRGKAEPTLPPTANAATASNVSASPSSSSPSPASSSPITSKGLLSFNTSNFTKLFKNSTNFVQSTFGSGLQAAAAQAPSTQSSSQPAAPFQHHNSNTVITEQSFTIPSIKNRNDASNPAAPKKQQRDILSTPVLIQPTSMTNSAITPLANLSSYKKITNEDSNGRRGSSSSISSTGSNSKAKQLPMANGSQSVHKTSTNVTVTISPANNNEQPSTTNTALPTKQIDTAQRQQKAPQTITQDPTSTTTITQATKLQNPQITSADNRNNMATLPRPTTAAAKKKATPQSNANIFFETVKLGKTTDGTEAPSSLQSKTSAPKAQSSSIKSNGSNESGRNVPSMPSGKVVITKNDMGKNSSNSATNGKVSASHQNTVNNMELKGARSRNNENVTMSFNRTNDSNENDHTNISINSSSSRAAAAATTIESTESSNILANVIASKSIKSYQPQYNNDNSVSNRAVAATDMMQMKYNNLHQIDDVLNNCDGANGSDENNIRHSSDNAMCNNNLDYNYDACVHQVSNSNANENPFKLMNSKSYLASNLMDASVSDSSDSSENIYANCMPMQPIMMKSIVNLDNYRQSSSQQDTNENVIASDNEIDTTSNSYQAADSPNNNYSDDDIEHFLSGDGSSMCNNNNNVSSEIELHDLLNDEGDTTATTSGNSTSSSSTSSDSSPSKSNQTTKPAIPNCFASKSNELYDILEESDDDERTTLFRFNRWNSSGALFVPKTSLTSMTSTCSASFAAAIAFANEMNSTNRNPFLQLISVSTTSNHTAGSADDQVNTITTTSATKSPNMLSGSCEWQQQQQEQQQKNAIGMAAPLISSVFNNNNDDQHHHQSNACMAFTSSDKCLTSSTLSTSNCANAWNEFLLQSPLMTATSTTTASLPPLSPTTLAALFPYESSHSSSSLPLQINGFIEQSDLPLLNSNNITNSMAKNRISSDVMDTMLLFLKEHGNQYIKQFMQVIYDKAKSKMKCVRKHKTFVQLFFFFLSVLVQFKCAHYHFVFSIFLFVAVIRLIQMNFHRFWVARSFLFFFEF